MPYGEDETDCDKIDNEHLIKRDPDELAYNKFYQCPEDYTFDATQTVEVNDLMMTEMISNHILQDSPCYRANYYTGWDLSFPEITYQEDLNNTVDLLNSVPISLMKLDYIQLAGPYDFLRILRKSKINGTYRAFSFV